MFWPQDIQLSDTQSPREILNTAQEEWRTSSDGIMELVLQDAISESGNSMIIVHAKHVISSRTATLLSIVYRAGYPYPVTIQPKGVDLPIFLKKSYYKPGARFLADMKENIPLIPTMSIAENQGVVGKQVLNQWVSDTPSEFREKLVEAFNLGAIKSEILNLALSTSGNTNIINEDAVED